MHLLGWLIFYIVTSAISYAVKRYIASRQKGLNEAPQNLPPVATGTPIPVLYGTQRMRPIPVWDGGEKLIPIKKQGQEIAKNHLERYQGLLCWDEANIVNVVFGDNPRLTITRLKPTYIVDGSSHPIFWMQDYLDIFHGGWGLIEIYAPDIFGEFDGCGGQIYIHSGSGQGTPDVIIESVEGVGNVPNYRDMMYLVFDYFRMGMDRSRSIDFVMSRMADMPYRIIDADPAAVAQGWRPWFHRDASIPAVIRDLMTDVRYGLGFDPSEIDTGNFNDVAYTVAGYGFGQIEVTGVSIALAGSQNEAKATIDECLRVLNAILIRHPESNQYQLKLIRDEAPTPEAFAALRHFDHKQIRKCKVTTKEWSETINEITIEWTNPAKMYEVDTVVVRNDASIAAIGYRPQKMSFRSVTDRDLAARIGIRELKAGSLRVERQTLKMTREAADLAQGDVFRATFKKCGYQDRLLRVLAVNLGSAWSGEVTVETIDDIFSHDGDGLRVVDPGTDPRVPRQRMPRITPEATYSLTKGYLHLVVDDPDGRLTAPGIEMRRQVGGAPPGDWFVVDSSTNWTADVDRSDVDLSRIFWRYTYVDENEETAVAGPFEAVFPLLGRSSVDWGAAVDQMTGTITATLRGISIPSGVVIQYFRVSLDDFAHYYEYSVLTGRGVDPDDPYASNPPPWVTPNLGSSIGGPLNFGESKQVKIRVFGKQYNSHTNTDDDVMVEDSLPVSRETGRTVTATWTIDGAGAVLGTGDYCWLAFNITGTATKWKVQGSPASTARFDFWRNNGGHDLPTVSDSLGLSFGPTAHEIEEGTFPTPFTINEGDNVKIAILSNDLGKMFTVSVTIENVIG